jgi:transcriptional regulator with XRE-family HTH domain
MSLLSEKIEELIDESGETVQTLAEMGNISRTTLQRMKSGERLPTMKNFRSLCKALRLSPTEEDELETLLEMATIGESTYYNRQKIIEIIEMISELTEYKIPFSKEINRKELEPVVNHHLGKPQIFVGESEVLGIIQNSIDKELFGSENPQLKMAISYEAVYQYIFQQMLGNQKKLMLQDVISLPKEGDAAEVSVERGLAQLKYLIALALLDNVEYQSNYYYQLRDSGFEHSALFPYFLVTSERVITISREYKRAVLYEDPDFLRLYEDGCMKIQEHVESFIEENNDPLTIYCLNSISQAKQVFEPLPCFAYYYTNDLLKKKLRKDCSCREELLSAACEYYENFQKENLSMLNFFSLKSLKKFMQDGSIYFPENIYIPFSPDERIMLVKQLREDLSVSKRETYAINEETLFLTSAIELVNECTRIRLILHYKNNQKFVFKTIVIREENIVNAFDDFFESLPDSKYVLSTERTIEEIDRMINEFEYNM